MVKMATQCIHFFVSINVAKFAISVWQFSPHCVVKFTIVYSKNYKTLWKSIVWELLPSSVCRIYYHTHSKNIDKYGKNPQSARRKPNYHTTCGKNCHKILSVQLRRGSSRRRDYSLCCKLHASRKRPPTCVAHYIIHNAGSYFFAR